MTSYALVVVACLNLPLIYFYTVIFLVMSGIWFTAGWVSARSFHMTRRITSFNLVLLVVIVLWCDNQFCIWYGMKLRGKYGKKEIAGYSMIKCVQLIRLSTRLSLCHLRGWKRNFPISLSTTMDGGLIRSLCWAYVNATSFFVFMFCILVPFSL